jgi:hypothetical protein
MHDKKYIVQFSALLLTFLAMSNSASILSYYIKSTNELINAVFITTTTISEISLLVFIGCLYWMDPFSPLFPRITKHIIYITISIGGLSVTNAHIFGAINCMNGGTFLLQVCLTAISVPLMVSAWVYGLYYLKKVEGVSGRDELFLTPKSEHNAPLILERSSLDDSSISP